jgi:hypothetical protein
MADTAVVTKTIGQTLASTNPDSSTNLGAAETKNVEVHSGTGGAGVIGITSGVVIITDSGAALLTLAAPTAGSPSAGGNDGQRLTIMSTTAQAHTVTTPSNKINGNKHVETFANLGDSCELVAYNGVWYVVGTATTTLS